MSKTKKVSRNKINEIAATIDSMFRKDSLHVSILRYVFENEKILKQFIKEFDKLNVSKVKTGDKVLYDGDVYVVEGRSVLHSLTDDTFIDILVSVRNFAGLKCTIKSSQLKKLDVKK